MKCSTNSTFFFVLFFFWVVCGSMVSFPKCSMLAGVFQAISGGFHSYILLLENMLFISAFGKKNKHKTPEKKCVCDGSLRIFSHTLFLQHFLTLMSRAMHFTSCSQMFLEAFLFLNIYKICIFLAFLLIL